MLREADGGPLVPGTDCHDFDAGPGIDPAIAITLPISSGGVVNFQWSEPWFGVQTDLDLYLVDAAGTVLARPVRGHGGSTAIGLIDAVAAVGAVSGK